MARNHFVIWTTLPSLRSTLPAREGFSTGDDADALSKTCRYNYPSNMPFFHDVCVLVGSAFNIWILFLHD